LERAARLTRIFAVNQMDDQFTLRRHLESNNVRDLIRAVIVDREIVVAAQCPRLGAFEDAKLDGRAGLCRTLRVLREINTGPA
jgi:hypothetical protein